MQKKNTTTTGKLWLIRTSIEQQAKEHQKWTSAINQLQEKLITLMSCHTEQENMLIQSLQFRLSAKAMYLPSVLNSSPIAR